MWLLSSSGQSSLFAAHFGMGFSFAHFINPVGGAQAVELYRARFQPSPDLSQPEANVAIFAFCSEDEEKIRQHQAVMDYRFLQFEKGGGIVPLAYEDVKDAEYTPQDLERIRMNRRRVITGTPQQMKEIITRLASTYDVDEIMLVTIAEDFNDRLKSYELLAQQFELLRPKQNAGEAITA